MKIILTPEQCAAVLPHWRAATQKLPPHAILIGQILREDWRDGARFYLDIKTVPGALAVAMRKAAEKERQKIQAKADLAERKRKGMSEA